MKFSKFLVKYLEEMGVKHIFGIPGDIQTDFAFALKNSSIQFITVRNEKSAGFMADIYSRVSGKLGVCFATVGPGATNLVSGLANANGDRSAVLAITDQVDEQFLESHQYIDQSRIFDPKTGVTKMSAMLDEENVKSILERVYREAFSEPRGAVHIGIPVALQKKYIKYSKPMFDVRPLPVIKNWHKLNQLIKGKRNLAIFGGVVNRLRINQDITQWIERCEIPSLVTFRGKGAIPWNHRLFIGTISRYLIEEISPLLKGIDNLILVGYDYNEGVKPDLWKDLKSNIININTYDNRLRGIFQPQINFFGGLSQFFKKIDAKGKNEIDIGKLRLQLMNKIYKKIDMSSYPIRPHRIIESINKNFPNAIKVCDVGKNKYYSGLLLEANDCNSVFFSNMQSAMGFSSGALGATFATENQVVVITGDGGFMMEPQEIATAKRYNKHLIVVIMNDNGLGLVRSKQLKDYNSRYEVDFPNPDFIKLAESFGAKGYSIRSAGEFDKLMSEVAKSNQFTIVDVPVDYSEGL
jgi:acetolactate synthase I/II/III large subunit